MTFTRNRYWSRIVIAVFAAIALAFGPTRACDLADGGARLLRATTTELSSRCSTDMPSNGHRNGSLKCVAGCVGTLPVIAMLDRLLIEPQSAVDAFKPVAAGIAVPPLDRPPRNAREV